MSKCTITYSDGKKTYTFPADKAYYDKHLQRELRWWNPKTGKGTWATWKESNGRMTVSGSSKKNKGGKVKKDKKGAGVVETKAIEKKFEGKPITYESLKSFYKSLYN